MTLAVLAIVLSVLSIGVSLHTWHQSRKLNREMDRIEEGMQ